MTKKNTKLPESWRKAGLGVEPDKVVAKRLGVSRQRVHQVRQQFGIALVPARRVKDILAKETRLGKVFDRVIAEERGVSNTSVAAERKRRGISALGRSSLGEERWQHLLGKVPDSTIAKDFGASRVTIRRCRKALGLPPVVACGPKNITKEAWLEAGLGRDSDQVVGRRLGVSHVSAYYARKRFGVPAASSFPPHKKVR